MGRLSGKHALITGATSGIGLETARQFVAEGAAVAITGRSQAGLDEARATLGDAVLTFRSDAGDVDDQVVLARQLSDCWPRLDVLMCNAADITHRAVADWDVDGFDAIVATNMKGPFFLVRALLALFSRPASIILVGSLSGLVGHEQSTVYGATKAGLMQMARGLSFDFLERGIRVNTIAPGPTVTNAMKFLGPEGEAEAHRRMSATIPIGRMASASEIAHAAVYLASDESLSTVATVFRIDGGIGDLIL